MKKYFGLTEMDLTMDDMKDIAMCTESYSYEFKFYDEYGFKSSVTVFRVDREKMEFILQEVQGLLLRIEKEEVSPIHRVYSLCFDRCHETFVMSVVNE